VSDQNIPDFAILGIDDPNCNISSIDQIVDDPIMIGTVYYHSHVVQIIIIITDRIEIGRIQMES